MERELDSPVDRVATRVLVGGFSDHSFRGFQPTQRF
jgi:hypothetical protein